MDASKWPQYTRPPRHPPPRVSGTALDTGWTPSAWLTAPEPSPYAMAVGGARYTHHAADDSLYVYKRLAHTSAVRDAGRYAGRYAGAPAGTAAGGYTEDDVNPYDPNAAYLREFHAWAAEQAARGAAHGIERFAYPDRWPGMSTAMARSSPLVPHFTAYGAAPPDSAAAAAAGSGLTPPSLPPLVNPLSPPVPPPADWAAATNAAASAPAVAADSWGMVMAAPLSSAAVLGTRRAQGGAGASFHRADWATAAATTATAAGGSGSRGSPWPAQMYH